ENAQELKTLFTQEMIIRGNITSSSVYVSLSYKKDHIDHYLHNVNDVFRKIKKAIDKNIVLKLLKEPIAHKGFQRLT
ncbi:MAG: aminotransferase class III, partial [Promethearchaeota archaeon]